jgi:enoyl-CoA hydratase/carnithine racemase
MTLEIEISRDGAVLIATLARPAKKNALTGPMYDRLIEALDEASQDPGIAAVLLRGSGGVFTAGNDIGDFIAMAMAGMQSGGAPASPGSRFIRKLADFDKPLVAAIEGQAVGIGTTLCFHCDLVYAAPDARFQMPFVNLGLVPEAGSSLLAPLRFGMARASEFLLLAEPFDAETAKGLGLVNAIVPNAGLVDHALGRAHALAAKPRQALMATRRMMRGDATALKARMDEELEAFAAMLRSPDAIKAFQTFLASRKPS